MLPQFQKLSSHGIPDHSPSMWAARETQQKNPWFFWTSATLATWRFAPASTKAGSSFTTKSYLTDFKRFHQKVATLSLFTRAPFIEQLVISSKRHVVMGLVFVSCGVQIKTSTNAKVISMWLLKNTSYDTEFQSIPIASNWIKTIKVPFLKNTVMTPHLECHHPVVRYLASPILPASHETFHKQVPFIVTPGSCLSLST